MLRYMLDADISSYAMRGAHSGLDRRMKLDGADVCISVVVKGELLFGIESSQHRSRIEASVKQFLQYISVVDLTEEVAQEYGVIRAELKRLGTPIGGNDMWIAAHARHLGLTLVTNNVREFSRVPGLVIENWAVMP